jgi:hypothetical protein
VGRPETPCQGGSRVATDVGGRGGVIRCAGGQDSAGGRGGVAAVAIDLVWGGERVWACVWTGHERAGLSPLTSAGQSQPMEVKVTSVGLLD